MTRGCEPCGLGRDFCPHCPYLPWPGLTTLVSWVALGCTAVVALVSLVNMLGGGKLSTDGVLGRSAGPAL